MAGATKASHTQMEKMLHFMEQHSELAHGKVSGVVDRTRYKNLWQTLTHILNTDFSGPSKHAMKWQKTWIDWKSNTKKKYMKIKNRAIGPDGLPLGPQSLSKTEERLIALLYPESLEEDVLLQEAGLYSAENEMLLDITGEKEEQFVVIEDIPEAENDDDGISTEILSTNLINESKGDLAEDLVGVCVGIDEKTENRKERRIDLEERKLLLIERTVRDKERRTDIFERAVRDKERRSEILDRVLRDKERRTDLYGRRVSDHGRRTDAFCKAVRDMEKRTEVCNRASTAFLTMLKTCSASLTLNKESH